MVLSAFEMYEPHFSDIFWISFDPNFKTTIPDQPSRLKKLCTVKLLSDASLIKQHLPLLPSQIHSILLSTAIDEGRILSILQLVKKCANKSIKLPIPDYLKSLDSVASLSEVVNQLEQFSKIAIGVLAPFFELIDANNSVSRLQCLDLGDIPLRHKVFYRIHDFLVNKRPGFNLLPPGYTLKCAVAIEKSADVYLICNCIEKAKVLGFRFIITGVCYYNNYYPDMAVMNLFEHLDSEDLQLVGFSFTSIVPSMESCFRSLSSFKFIKCLHLSYLSEKMSSVNEEALQLLTAALTKLTFLERLVLKAFRLTGQLSAILRGFCKNESEDSDQTCCLIHNGRLEFLDVSACRLTGNDLEVIRELGVKNSLKYLNIGENDLEPNSTFETLLSLKLSLRVLDMEKCFPRLPRVFYDPSVFPLKQFQKLKYLNIKGISMTEETEEILEKDVAGMSNLEIFISDKISDFEIDHLEFE